MTYDAVVVCSATGIAWLRVQECSRLESTACLMRETLYVCVNSCAEDDTLCS